MSEDQPRRRGTPAKRATLQGGHRLSIRSERRSPVDIRKLSRAVIQIAQAQAEAEAQAAHEAAINGQDTPKEAA